MMESGLCFCSFAGPGRACAGEEGFEDGRALEGGDFLGVEEKCWGGGVKTAPV
jgi:hypothetical protein